MLNFPACLPCWRRRAAYAALLLPVLLACGSEALKPLPDEEGEFYWALTLNHSAATLSIGKAGYDTLSLSATPTTFQGTPITTNATAIYESRDLKTVVVMPGNILRGLKNNTQPVWVVASLTIGNVKHRDSVLVKVLNEPEPVALASLSIHPTPPDSAKVGVDIELFDASMSNLEARAVDTNGNAITNVAVVYRSLHRTVADVHPVTGTILPIRRGDVTMVANATVFGVAKADTVPFRIGAMLSVNIARKVIRSSLGMPTTVFEPAEIVVGTGGVVSWTNSSWKLASGRADDSLRIAFTEADQSKLEAANTWNLMPGYIIAWFGFCTSSHNDCDGVGNISLDASFQNSRRVLREPGIYEYYDPRDGARGRIIVVSD